MFNTPNGGILQTDVVLLQSAISTIKGNIHYILLNIDKFSKQQNELTQQLQAIDKICSDALFSNKFEKDEIEQAIKNAN